MEIDDKIYLLYDIIEEIKHGVALACATHGKYSDIDIYHNNEVIYSYTKVIKYEINNEHIVVRSGEQYTIEIKDIISIESLKRLSDNINNEEVRGLGPIYRKRGRIYTCALHKHDGWKQLIFNKELDILNCDFKEIASFTNYGALCSFKTNISEDRRLLGFKADKVIMWSKTGKILCIRKSTVIMNDGEINDGARIIIALIVLSIIVGISMLEYMIVRRM